MKDANNKVMQNYHRISLQFLTNIFMTDVGKQIMQDIEKGNTLLEFCNSSLQSVNQKVQYHTALLLFNYLLCFQKDNKKEIQSNLEIAFKHIDELLSDKNLNDKDTLMALLLVECRALYTNGPMCTWVEE